MEKDYGAWRLLLETLRAAEHIWARPSSDPSASGFGSSPGVDEVALDEEEAPGIGIASLPQTPRPDRFPSSFKKRTAIDGRGIDSGR